ncbi:MAG: aldehyde dehydrogenase (NADP(+)) [Acidimicrobiales bacterium]
MAGLDLDRAVDANSLPRESSVAEVDRIIGDADQVAPALFEIGAAGRARLLSEMADEMERDIDALVEVSDAETALGEPRLRAEAARACYQLRFFAGVVREGSYLEATIDHATTTPTGPTPDLRRMLYPLGPVAVFGASNFPFAFSVPGQDTASAIAAGCPVVAKAHPAHPVTSERSVAALRRAAASCGMPEETVGLVYGLRAGGDIVRHRAIRAVGFTGSQRAGRALFDLASARSDPIPFYGELGSVNPVVVTPQAARERPEGIGADFVASFTLSLGQYCTKPGLFFVPAGKDGDAVRAAASSAVGAVPPGILLTLDIREFFMSGIDLVGRVENVSALARGDRAPGTKKVAVSPVLFEVDAATLASPEGRMLRREYFGPTAIVVDYANEDDLVAALGTLDNSLAGAMEIGEGETALPKRLAEFWRDRVGRIVVNGYPTGVAINWAIHHGGPYPATTNPLHTSVGASAIRRWLRPVAFQSMPDELLPPELQEQNPLAIPRRVDGVMVPVA